MAHSLTLRRNFRLVYDMEEQELDLNEAPNLDLKQSSSTPPLQGELVSSTSHSYIERIVELPLHLKESHWIK